MPDEATEEAQAEQSPEEKPEPDPRGREHLAAAQVKASAAVAARGNGRRPDDPPPPADPTAAAPSEPDYSGLIANLQAEMQDGASLAEAEDTYRLIVEEAKAFAPAQYAAFLEECRERGQG